MTTWVLLRGWAREARHWGAFPEALQQRLGPQGRVLALDLPGNGLRGGERSPVHLGQAVETLRRELHGRGAHGPFIVVALSLGGMAAMHWACAYPRELRGCALLNTSAGKLAPFWRRLRPSSYPRLLGVLRPGLQALQRERRILALTSNLRGADDAIAQQWAAYADQRPVALSNALRQLLAAVRFRVPAAAPQVPLLLLASERDELVSVQCSRALASLWDAPLRLHPQAGHDLPLDAPDWVIAKLLDWANDSSLIPRVSSHKAA